MNKAVLSGRVLEIFEMRKKKKRVCNSNRRCGARIRELSCLRTRHRIRAPGMQRAGASHDGSLLVLFEHMDVYRKP